MVASDVRNNGVAVKLIVYSNLYLIINKAQVRKELI